jgi:hypothetical protein
MPYWENSVKADHEKVKASYYRYTTLTGEVQLLAFVVNISSKPIEKVTVDFGEKVSSVTDMALKTDVGFTFNMDKYGYRILYLK